MFPRLAHSLVLSITAMSCITAHAAPETAPAVAELHALFDAAWERDLRDDPRAASSVGDRRYNDRWADQSPAAYARRAAEYTATLQALARIDARSLPQRERVSHEMLRRLYRNQLDLFEFNAQQRPLDQLNYSNGVLTANEVAGLIDFAAARDYEDWTARLRAMGRSIDQNIMLLRDGVRARNTQPRVIVERVRKQLESHLLDDPARSPFYVPFMKMPDGIDAEQRTRLRQAAQEVIRTTVVPAYRRLAAFIDQEYLPAARTTVGIWDTPRGDEFYRNRVQWFTTTHLTPDEIHAMGLKEVARIRAAMEQIIQQVQFKGSFAEFLTYLRTDPRFRYQKGEDLLQAYMAMAKRIDPLLPEYFGKLPRTPYGVRPIPPANAPDTTTAYYEPLSADGRRPGYYYVNLYRPEERPTYEIPVLTAHEAVPGHHVQQALAKEQEELPNFRRNFEATAYVEGWALYAESLADEMGLYADPYDKFGQLTYEMWRAVRLVIDTGLHARHWTREQAIDYFKANAAKSELDIVNEVDRYIAWPGQATAYKIGELKIQELRRRASAQLGPKFDLRAFHDTVLASGAVPLDVLEANIDEWMAKQR